MNGLGQGVFVYGGTLSVVNGGTLQDNADLLVASTMVDLRTGLVGHGGRRHRSRHLRGRRTLTISNGGTLNSQGGAEIDGFFDTRERHGDGRRIDLERRRPPACSVGGGTTGGSGMLTISNGGQVNVDGHRRRSAIKGRARRS